MQDWFHSTESSLIYNNYTFLRNHENGSQSHIISKYVIYVSAITLPVTQNSESLLGDNLEYLGFTVGNNLLMLILFVI